MIRVWKRGGGTGRTGVAPPSSSSSTPSVRPVLLFLTALGCAFVTYNTLIAIFHHSIPTNGTDIEKSELVSDDSLPSSSKFHVAVTATDASYIKWQCRIMYYWFKRFRDMPGSEMGGFTRVLHSGSADNLMDEIPTFVVDRLPPDQERNYIVLNRPWAFVQWLEKAEIQEDYIMMAEPDHIFVKPLPNLAQGAYPAAFRFFYINPEANEKIIRKFYPEEKGPVTDVAPIGNSPVIIKKSQLKKIAPTWMDVSMRMKDDPEADKAFGWVLEMYGYTVASALHGVRHTLHKEFMIQPPWDLKIDKAFIIHYTYGCPYTLKGKLAYDKDNGEWLFDKRSYLDGPPPRNLSLPPPGVPESVVTLVKMVNEASANIPGWDDERWP